MIDADAVEPMPDPGAQLLDDLHAALTKYVVFPNPAAAVATALWIATTHVLPAFQHAPRLVLNSPEKRCGKSRALDIIAGTCHHPLMSVNATVAAIFRSIGKDHPPTLIIDEADTLFGTKRAAEQNEDLRALVNAGHQRNRPVLRCVGPLQTPTEFNTFAMVALAGIGKLPDTITDRAANITMRRRASIEHVSQFRSRRDGPILKKLQDRLAEWGAAHIEQLANAEPDMPVEDRAADTWEPLVAVADAAGGRWPKLARTACLVLEDAASAADEDSSLNVKLLADIRNVFTERDQSFLSSKDLVWSLCLIEESPWSDFELNTRKLANRLKPFGVKPAHNTTKTARGYDLASLTDAFRRYLRPDPSSRPDTDMTSENEPDGKHAPDGYIRPVKISVQDETAGQTMFSDSWTDPDAPSAQNGHSAERRYCACGAELWAQASIDRGQCEKCRLLASRGQS